MSNLFSKKFWDSNRRLVPLPIAASGGLSISAQELETVLATGAEPRAEPRLAGLIDFFEIDISAVSFEGCRA